MPCGIAGEIMIIRVTHRDLGAVARGRGRIYITGTTPERERARAWMGRESYQSLRDAVREDGAVWCDVPLEQVVNPRRTHQDARATTGGTQTTISSAGQRARELPSSAPRTGQMTRLTSGCFVSSLRSPRPGDPETALERCGALNTWATTNRWIIAPGNYEGTDGEMLWIACSFVAGPHNMADLAAFAAWCVREQIATATAKITSDLPEQLGGRPCILDHADGAYRAAGDWSEVVRHYDRIIEPRERSAAGQPRGCPDQASNGRCRGRGRVLRHDHAKRRSPRSPAPRDGLHRLPG
jgi:hypothetical protein